VTRVLLPVYDPGDLLAEKFGTAGGWMTDTMRVDTKLFELCGGDIS
jgi:hypothetical protein